jgi:hypothetical protein
MNLDGSEGASFDIEQDVLIGRYRIVFLILPYLILTTQSVDRDKNCNVRIKLTSISRQHAKIILDESGKVRPLFRNFAATITLFALHLVYFEPFVSDKSFLCEWKSRY